MRVNLSDTGGGFDAIPAGKYQARITDGELREAGPNAKHTGSEYINWEFTVTEGDFESRKLWQNTPWSHGSCDCGDWKPGSLFGLKAILKSSGIWTDDELNADDFDFEIDDIIGSEFSLVVTVREYNGEDTNDVKKVKPASAGSDVATSLLP